ncbi:glycosyltransferase family 2 protein [Flavobacterium silvaticum]|uniref:Glycosyltransferase family 2 protein n=1 Tax=Flavobacterium silvaticum TaxID=1852020 RepID=A0A972JJ86_9FLAO|nr:glycosyltransferase family 2 protein [Flavobacterium silvaticum]NMH29098.1 glycosyltransferase family 2 protein [Flavobacterium silvaticum]
MSQSLRIAIVILNWNGAGLLRKFLPSVVNYSPDAEIWVADNASTDDSVAVLKSEFPSVKIVVNNKNYGFAGGYNEALKSIDADVYALVNSDIEVTNGWLDSVRSRFESNLETGIIQPKILDYKNKGLFEYAGAAGGFIDKFGYPFCRGRLFDTLEKDEGQYNDDHTIFWASGACFFIRKTIFDNLGGFDEDFFAHQEEIDLCWRAFNSGHEAFYISQSTVYHLGGATLNEGHPRKTYLNFRNSLLMLAKNLPSKRLIPVIFIRLCLDGIAAIRFLFQGKIRHFFEVAHAHFGFYKRLPSTLVKRKNSQYDSYFAVKNLIFSYFIQGKKRFTDLF